MLQAYSPGDSIGSARSVWDCVLWSEKINILTAHLSPYSCHMVMLKVKAPFYAVRELQAFKNKV